MLKALALFVAIGASVYGCTGGDDKTSEPVANDNATPAIPDSPGESGESAEKPAGAGEAGLPDTEKSQPNMEAAAKVAPSADPGTVNTGALNVRSGPGMKYDVVKVLQRGEKVELTDCGAVWCKIAEGQYVSKRFVN